MKFLKYVADHSLRYYTRANTIKEVYTGNLNYEVDQVSVTYFGL